MQTKKCLSGSSQKQSTLDISDVFSTYVYTGNAGRKVIRNGINLGDDKVALRLDGDVAYDTSAEQRSTTNTDVTATSDGLLFNGSTSYLEMTPLGRHSTITIEFDVKANNNGYYYVLDTGLGNRSVVSVNFDATTGYVYFFDGTTTTWLVQASGLVLPAGVWHNIAYVLESNVPKLYVNGVYQSGATYNNGSFGEDTGNIIIGSIANTSGWFLDGNIKNFTITLNDEPAYSLGEGGMVWTKGRDVAYHNQLFDTERGAGWWLRSNSTEAQDDEITSLSSFNTDGFSVGNWAQSNALNVDYVSWTFKKQPRFFDMVKYTGNGVAGREIAHNLGCDVGMMIVKRTDGVNQWMTYHRSEGATKGAKLDNTDPFGVLGLALWNNTEPTDTVFTVGTSAGVNSNGYEYIAYLFADDPLGASGDGSDGMIACGSYVGNGSLDGTEIDLGWEPQYLIIKRTTGIQDWLMYDCIRGIVNGGTDPLLKPNTSDAEITSFDGLELLPTGFKLKATGTLINGSGETYIYMAIRRPMKEPTSSDEVFAIIERTSTGVNTELTVGFAPDMIRAKATNTGYTSGLWDRLRGKNYLDTVTTAPEVSQTDGLLSFNNLGVSIGSDSSAGTINYGTSTNYINHFWKRAKGFFDVVAYTGNGGGGRTVNHNLGVVPEMIWVKKRNTSGTSWMVYTSHLGISQALQLNSNAVPSVYPYFHTVPTDSVFYVNDYSTVNASADTYIAYLFATLPGISKVGSYTGNGTSQTIDCGFTTGAKFIIVKRTDSTGDWFMWDSVRGIVAGNDPHLSLNTTAAEVTTDDSIDPDTSGFIVNQNATTNINVSSATYIYYSIAEGA